MTVQGLSLAAGGTALTGPLRLNLGGRTTRIPGFKTVDLYEGDGVDISADVSKLPLEDGTVDQIYASHVLEHFPHPRTNSVLAEWNRVLRKGGKAFISVPDFDAMVKLYNEFGMSDFIRNMLWGDQLYDLAFHYTGFTFSFLAKAAIDAGFSDVKRLAEMPYGIKDCSKNIDTLRGRSISINIEALK